MAHGVIEVLPRIRRLSRKFACRVATAEELESVAVLAVIEAIPKFDEERGEWVSFATKVAQTAMIHELCVSNKRNAALELFDALSASLTIALLAKSHKLGGGPAFQDEDAYVAEIMSRLETNALGKMLFAESLNGRISCEARAGKRRGQKGRTLRTRLSQARNSAKELLDS